MQHMNDSRVKTSPIEFPRIRDDELDRVHAAAYRGEPYSVLALIQAFAEREMYVDAVAHAERLSQLGFAEASGALADWMEEVPEIDCLVHGGIDKWLRLKMAHAESERPGCGQAAFHVARHFANADNTEGARSWYLRAAAKGHEEAALCLGWMHVGGEGIEPNPLEAARWFMRSVAKEEASMLEVLDQDDVPVNRQIGWTDWELFGRLAGMLSSTQERIDLVRIVSTPVVLEAFGDEAIIPQGATLH